MFLVVDPPVCTWLMLRLCVPMASEASQGVYCLYLSLSAACIFPCSQLGKKAVPGAGLLLLSTVLKEEHPEDDEGLCCRVLREAKPTNTIDMTHNHLGPAQTKAVSCKT